MAPLLDTYADLIDHLSDYAGGDGALDRGLRDYRRAAQMAYRDLSLSHEWKAYLTRGRIVFNAAQTTGTIEFDLTGGAYERQVTLTDWTWPSWAIYGTLLIDGIRYKIEDRKSNTVITLTEDSCPSADIASGEAYTLYQNIYPLPCDFRRLSEIHYEQGMGPMRSLPSVSDWLGYDQENSASGRPYLYAIGGSPDLYAQMALHVHPYPNEAESVDFIYWRNARPLYYTGYETECRAGTVTGTAGSNAVTGTSTTFTAKMIGSVIRFSRNSTDYPEGVGGLNPFQEQRIIAGVTSATAITLDAALDYSYSGVKYCVCDPIDCDGALLVSLYRNAEMQLNTFRSPDKVPFSKSVYVSSWREARERDERLLPSCGLYGAMWQYGGGGDTLIFQTVTSDSGDGGGTDPDPGGGTDPVPALLFSQTEIRTAASTSSEYSLHGTGEGSRTIAANTWGVGDVIVARASGTYGTKASSAGTLTIRLSSGSTVLHSVSATMPDNQSGKSWTMETVLTRHSIGPSGTVSGIGLLEYSVNGEGPRQHDDDPVSNEALDSSVDQTVTLTAQWSASDASNTITCSSFTIALQEAS